MKDYIIIVQSKTIYFMYNLITFFIYKYLKGYLKNNNINNGSVAIRHFNMVGHLSVNG